MPTAMVTFNGRITLPSNVRKELGLKTGDSVDFVEVEKGRFAICNRNNPTMEIERRLPNPGNFSAVEEMDKVIH